MNSLLTPPKKTDSTVAVIIQMLQPVLKANGIDLKALLNNTRQAGQSKADEAKALRAAHSDHTNKEIQIREIGLTKAANAIKLAKSKHGIAISSAARLRADAQEFIKAANNLAHPGPFSFDAKKSVEVMVKFLGKDLTVILADMAKTSEKNEAEAVKLETEAATALKAAKAADVQAQANVMAAFKTAIAGTAADTKKAEGLEAEAAAFFASADFFTVK